MNRAVSLAALLVFTLNSHAGDAEAGKTTSIKCQACHGIEGISNNDAWPNLAGQKKGYLVAQLQAYRAGTRKDLMMTPLAKKLSDKQIDDLAAYFASL
jgi:cytochrome c553